MNAHDPQDRIIHFELSVLEQMQRELQPFLALGELKNQRERKVLLLESGQNKAAVIRSIRDICSLPLVEAKALVDSAPSQIPLRAYEIRAWDEVSDAIREDVWALEKAGAVLQVDPEDEWEISSYTPNFFTAFPALQLNPDWELVSQVYSGPDEHFGRIWAKPRSDTSWYEQPDLERGYPPRQRHSIAAALQGDGTPESYLQASVLIREVDSLNGCWKDTDWSSHSLISQPTDRDWSWGQTEVSADADFRPSLAISPSGAVVVKLFTESRHVEVRLMRHQDHYTARCYQPRSDFLLCASGGRGYVH